MTSAVDGDLTAIQTGPCGLKIDGDWVGHTMEGIRFTVTPDLRRRQVDETGTHVVELIYQGESIEVSSTLAEKTMNTMALVYPWGYQINSTSWGWGRLPGTKGTSLAKELIIHPLEMLAVTTEDVTFWKAVVSASNEVQFGVITADRVFAVTWTILVDLTKNDGQLLGKIGAPASA